MSAEGTFSSAEPATSVIVTVFSIQYKCDTVSLIHRSIQPTSGIVCVAGAGRAAVGAVAHRDAANSGR